MDINSILNAVKPLRNRMHINKINECLVYGLIAGAGLVMLLQLVSLFFPVLYQGMLSVGIMCVFLALSFLIGLIVRPSVQATARMGDSLGLKERLVTALELAGDTDPLSRMQRYDTFKKLAEIDFNKLYPIKVDTKKLAIGLGIILAAAGMTFIPAPAKDRAARQENLRAEIKQQVVNVKKERVEIEKNKNLTSQQVREIDKKLMELQKDLEKAKTESDAIKALSKAREEIRELKDMGKQLEKLGEKLAEHPASQALGEKLKEGNLRQIEEDLKTMNNQLKNMTREERQEFAEFLKKAAEELKNDGKLAQNIRDLAAAMSSGELNALSEQLGELASILQDLAAQDTAIAQAMNDLSSALASSSQQIASSASGQQGGNPASSASSQTGGQSSSPGQAGSPGQGSNPGQGNQPGQGGQGNSPGNGGNQGSGQGGQGASGAGNGTSNGNLPYSQLDGSQGGRESPADKNVRDYEKIYSPSHLGGDSQASTVKGSKGTGGESEFRNKEQDLGIKGEPVPYDQVYGEYKSEAMQSIQEGEVAPSMKKIVEEYFSSLE